MTLKPLDHSFALRSGLSSRPPKQVARDEFRIELEEELDKRLRVYPGHVAKGMMKQQESDHHIAVWRALLDDRARADAAIAQLLGQHPPAHEPAPYAFDWDTRVRELRRELALRRAAYPKWIASPTNPLTAADATKKLERLDAIHHDYWIGLFAFSPSEIDPADDPARFAWIARDHRLSHRAGWDAAVAEGGAAEHAACIHASHWRAIEKLARHVAEGGEPFRLLAGADLIAIATTSTRAVDQALDDWQAGTIEEPLIGHLSALASWLRRLAPGPVAIDAAQPTEERKAA